MIIFTNNDSFITCLALDYKAFRELFKNKTYIQMCKGTCHAAISALLTYVFKTRIGFCKLCILICGVVSSALVGATFTNGKGDVYDGFKHDLGGEFEVIGLEFVLFATTWWLVESLRDKYI